MRCSLTPSVEPRFSVSPQTQRTSTSHDVGMGSRGPTKQSKAVNLLKCLRGYRQDVWRFMSDEGVPFTNNLAGQALRLAKVQEKEIGMYQNRTWSRKVLHDPLLIGNHAQAKSQSV